MTRFDVLTVGNAIVDIIARCDDQFLIDNKITKAAMNLIDAERAELLYSRMGPALEASGGSAGNTAAGVANFGGRAAYFGKVAEDQLGEIFEHDIRAQGVHYETRPKGTFPPTARSMIFVTEDGERSMNTYLGACVELGPEDVEPDVVADAKVTYFEGYLWDSAARQGSDPRMCPHCPCPWPGSVDDALRQFLRRPVSRRIPRPDALWYRRYRLCQS